MDALTGPELAQERIFLTSRDASARRQSRSRRGARTISSQVTETSLLSFFPSTSPAPSASLMRTGCRSRAKSQVISGAGGNTAERKCRGRARGGADQAQIRLAGSRNPRGTEPVKREPNISINVVLSGPVAEHDKAGPATAATTATSPAGKSHNRATK